MVGNLKIGNFIAEERKNKKLTQEDLASKLFINRSAISKWERGISLPDCDLIIKMCDIFGITTEEFFAGERSNIKNK